MLESPDYLALPVGRSCPFPLSYLLSQRTVPCHCGWMDGPSTPISACLAVSQGAAGGWGVLEKELGNGSVLGAG